MAKKRKAPRKRMMTEAQVRDAIARHEKLLDAWLKKLQAATTKVQEHSKKAAYYNARLDVLAKRREAATTAARKIDLTELDD